MKRVLGALYDFILSTGGWLYVRALIWAKHIVLCGTCDPSTLGWFGRAIIRRHDALSPALVLTCVDPRFSDLGEVIHAWITFGMLRRETGKLYRVYGLRLAGPDACAPLSGNAVTEAYHAVIRHQCSVVQPEVIVTTAHDACAGMCACPERHLELQQDAARAIHGCYPDALVIALFARAQVFGWRMERVATIPPRHVVPEPSEMVLETV